MTKVSLTLTMTGGLGGHLYDQTFINTHIDIYTLYLYITDTHFGGCIRISVCIYMYIYRYHTFCISLPLILTLYMYYHLEVSV